MTCTICGKTHGYFEEEHRKIEDFLENTLSKMKLKLAKELIEIANRNEYNEDNRKKVSNIKTEIHGIKMSAVLDNLDSFMEIDQSIRIILKYYKQHKTDNMITIKDIMDAYLDEPKVTTYTNTLYMSKNIENIEKHMARKKEIQFYEIQINNSIFGMNNIPIGCLDSDDQKKINEIIEKKIVLCPICDFLFKKASSAALTTKEAEDDWD